MPLGLKHAGALVNQMFADYIGKTVDDMVKSKKGHQHVKCLAEILKILNTYQMKLLNLLKCAFGLAQENY